MITQIHQDMVPLVLAAGAITLILGLVALYQVRRAPAGAVPRSLTFFRRMLAVTAAIGVLQAIFGGILFLQGCRPGDNLHFVYGLIVLGAVPVAYAYSDQKQVRRDIIIMSIAAVAIIGAAVRAWMTGSGVCP